MICGSKCALHFSTYVDCPMECVPSFSLPEIYLEICCKISNSTSHQWTQLWNGPNHEFKLFNRCKIWLILKEQVTPKSNIHIVPMGYSVEVFTLFWLELHSSVPRRPCPLLDFMVLLSCNQGSLTENLQECSTAYWTCLLEYEHMF